MAIKYGKYMLGGMPAISLNIPQLAFIVAPQKHKFIEWSRGAGKSTVLSWSVKEKPLTMPRGSFFLVGETYSQILTRTLPSTINGLAMLGYHQNVHFFVGRKAPARWKWDLPYEPPMNFDHAIHWISGACTHLISLDMVNSGRGLNTWGGDGDEAALLDYERLFNNVLTTNRAGRKHYPNNPLLNSYCFASSVPMTNKGKWLYKMEEQAINEPDKIYYSRADSRHNAHNLGKDWFKENKRVMTDLVYNAEILNIRPDRVEGGFYALFSEDTHTKDFFDNGYLLGLGHNYDKAINAGCLADGDLIKDKPIDIAFDWGANINVVHAEQEYNGKSHGLKSMFVLTPNTVDVLVNDFCDYYAGHGNKTVVFWHDHTAVAKGNTGMSYAEIVIDTFRKRGWLVISKYMGQAPGHHDKFLFWGTFLKGNDTRLPKFLLNRTNCKYMTISMQQAGVLQGRNGFEKDKRPEKQKNAIHEETTHFSDAADTLYYFKYSSRLKDGSREYDLPGIY